MNGCSKDEAVLATNTMVGIIQYSKLSPMFFFGRDADIHNIVWLPSSLVTQGMFALCLEHSRLYPLRESYFWQLFLLRGPLNASRCRPGILNLYCHPGQSKYPRPLSHHWRCLRLPIPRPPRSPRRHPRLLSHHRPSPPSPRPPSFRPRPPRSSRLLLLM